MTVILGPDGTPLRSRNFLLAVPDYGDASTVTANLTPSATTALADLLTMQPADFCNFDGAGPLVLTFTSPTRAPLDVVAMVLASVSTSATWKVEVGDSSDEAIGTQAFDASGNARHGTLAGTAAFDIGKFQSGVRLFDGTSDWITSGSIPVGVNYTVMGWFNPDAIGDERVLFRHAAESNCRGTLNADGTVEIGLGPTAKSTTALLPGYWYHLAFVFESGDLVRLYVDGALEADVFGETANLTPGTDVIRFGRNTTGAGADTGFLGTMDDLRVYARAFTEADVQAEMASETPVSTTNLELQYRLNGYQTATDTFGMPPNLSTYARRSSFLLTPYQMTPLVVRVTVTDPAAASSSFSIGRAFLGPCWQPTRNYDYGIRYGHVDETKTTRTPSSQTLVGAPREPIPFAELTVRHLSQDDMLVNAYELQRVRGASREVLLCADQEDDALKAVKTLYGLMTDPQPFTMPFHDLWEWSVRVEGLL